MSDQRIPAPAAAPTGGAFETGALLEFPFRLGQAHLACGESVAQVEGMLRRVAAAYGVRRSRVIVFRTALLLTMEDATSERVTVAEGPAEPLRMGELAERARVDALDRAQLRAPGEPLHDDPSPPAQPDLRDPYHGGASQWSPSISLGLIAVSRSTASTVR